MIASLRGILLEKTPGSCVIEAGGVGYAVSVSARTARALPEAGEALFLHTRQVVREDAHMLFGFTGVLELQLFDLLISVSGVGPKVALALLSGLEPAALSRAIRAESIAELVAVPGIGRKTAERLVVELRDKLELLGLEAGAPAPKGAPALPRSEKIDDAVAALTRLGYTPAQAQDALRRVSEGHDELNLEALVRRSLALLTRSATAAR
ncbi:MAG TPA: Holliday junction branch migration protein RuvA [Candidatus Udaeobacter sp.]|jgi:Holliday junction DNA helicase RuvA|nr:Holliday junction branch migration protein RuvA [Candidatus Udaeobacter sp.]